jgi:hypothetical protein
VGRNSGLTRKGGGLLLGDFYAGDELIVGPCLGFIIPDALNCVLLILSNQRSSYLDFQDILDAPGRHLGRRPDLMGC